MDAWKMKVLILALAAAGCMTQAQYLVFSRQPEALQTAITRGQSDMKCATVKGEQLSQTLAEPVPQGPKDQREERALFTIAVDGCGQRRVYQVSCPVPGDDCTVVDKRSD